MKKNMGQGECDNCNSVIYAQWVCYGKKNVYVCWHDRLVFVLP